MVTLNPHSAKHPGKLIYRSLTAYMRKVQLFRLHKVIEWNVDEGFLNYKLMSKPDQWQKKNVINATRIMENKTIVYD